MTGTLLEALQRAVERSGVDLKELAARVGRADGYLTHLFKGRITLTAEHLFVVLLAIGVSPEDFLSRFFGKVGYRELDEDDFDARVLRVMERHGIKPRRGDDDQGGGGADTL